MALCLMMDAAMEDLARKIRPETRLTVLTGAGVSAASGVPTFRGPDGLWKKYRPESLATPEAFQRDPKLVWEWYDWRRQILVTKKPNRAHEVLAAWSRRYPKLTLITQSVDGLHERAGSSNVIRFHGSIWEVLCWNNCPSSPERWWDETVPFPEIPPKCPHCNGLIRPGVVWFGEGIDPEVMRLSVAQNERRGTTRARCRHRPARLFGGRHTSALRRARGGRHEVRARPVLPARRRLRRLHRGDQY